MGLHGAIRIVLVVIGLVVAVPTLGIVAVVAGLGGGGSALGNGDVGLLLFGLLALVPVAAIERKHFWVTLIPLAMIALGALGFYVHGGFFSSS